MRRVLFALAAMFSMLSGLSGASSGDTRLSGFARVIDGDTIAFGATSVRLAGVDTPERNQPCEKPGSVRNCGASARLGLESLIGGRMVTCEQAGSSETYGRPVGLCRAGDVDLTEAMLAGGFGKLDRTYAYQWPRALDRFAAAEAVARNARLGIWAEHVGDPSSYRPGGRRSSGGDCPPDRPVKANINPEKDTRIYHMPEDRLYGRTRIDLPGEACFAIPAEAEAAGFRRSKV